MDDSIIDLLQIKIEKAKAQLSEDTLNAINSVDWKAIILEMRDKKGFTFEQLDALELETELVLCGLVSVADYPKELRARMKLGEAQTNELVNEMNEQVFAKIKDELIKRTERKKIFEKEQKPENLPPLPNSPRPDPLLVKEREDTPDTPEVKKINAEVLGTHGIEIIGEGPGVRSDSAPSILAQKLSGPVQMPAVKTEHTLDNLTKTAPSAPIMPEAPKTTPTSYPPKGDPYRLPPE
jgi:hypothetical protein